MPVETEPAEEAQVDSGYAGLLRDPGHDTPRKAWALVMTFSLSRHSDVKFVVDQEVDTWLRCHRRAFESFGGDALHNLLALPLCHRGDHRAEGD